MLSTARIAVFVSAAAPIWRLCSRRRNPAPFPRRDRAGVRQQRKRLRPHPGRQPRRTLRSRARKQMRPGGLERTLSLKLAEYRWTSSSWPDSSPFSRRICGPLARAHSQRPPLPDPAFCGKGYYGLKVHEAALERGVKVTGATVHLVTKSPTADGSAAKGGGSPARRYAGGPPAPGHGTGRVDSPAPGAELLSQNFEREGMSSWITTL